ncbi:peptidase [Nonomuraea monospora]|uniref:Peptidase n=1 Tax=Nonomuraea monospora TaxID=568818 RepID=A0ABP5PBE5_9ACTN
MRSRTSALLSIPLLASLLLATPSPAAADNVVTAPLAASQTAAAEVATFWLSDNGANLTAATPYDVQTAVSKIITKGGGVTPDTKPGSVSPMAPVTGEAATSGKVFFLGADGLPHWCTGTSVQSQYRNVVATAAHCVFDTETPGSRLGKWVFVPGYADGAAPSGLYVGKQVFGHYDFDVYGDYDRDYAFVNVYGGVVSSATGELANFGRLGDNVGGQGLAWNQPLGSTVEVFGYPAGPHPDGQRPYTGETLETSSGLPVTAIAPEVKGEELLAVDSPFTGAGSLGSSWLLRYDEASGRGYLNGLTLSVTDTDADQRYDTSLSPYFDGELAGIYKAAATLWTGAALPG